MAYGNYGNRGNYGGNGSNYGNRGGNYGGNNGGYQKQSAPPPTPEEFINQRLDIYLAFADVIKERGLDVGDFAFFLGGWITSYALECKNSR